MLPFVLGTATIVAPQIGLPVVGLNAGVQLIKTLRKRKSNKSECEQAGSVQKWNDLALMVSTSGPPPVKLSWRDLTCTISDKKSGEIKKALLSGISGAAQPGRLTAILGPSGSGKTTLLNTLAGQLPTGKTTTLTGILTVNGVPSTHSNHRQAYVQQEDVFYSELTVFETMTTAAELRLPQSMSSEEKKAYVTRLMDVLGLTKVSSSRVGDTKRRGLSGGEKKRLSLGCELIGSPSLIFLDEPTSGLDAAAAEKVMATLKALAAAGHTVVCSIHQPRSSIWDMFDDLVLLHEGQTVYQGPAAEALPHFASLGYVCPANYNPAEFLSDLISPEYSATPGKVTTHRYSSAGGGDNGSQDATERVAYLIQVWKDHPHPMSRANTQGEDHEDSAVHEGAGGAPKPMLSWLQQVKLLARRSWRQVIRDKPGTISRIVANVSSALLFGMIFWRMGKSQTSIQDRMGLMQVLTINTAMSSLSKTLNVFPRERLIVNRERAKHSYATNAYLLAKLAAELPISAAFPLLFGVMVYPMCGLDAKVVKFTKFLGIITLSSFASSAFGMMVGAFAPTTDAAMAIGPALMTVWIVFGGYYVNADNVPGALKWLPKASLIKQAFAALVINEMKGMKFDANPQGVGMTTGEQVLDWLSLGNTTAAGASLQLARITGFYYVAAYSILLANKPRFQPLLPPRSKNNGSHEGKISEADEDKK